MVLQLQLIELFHSTLITRSKLTTMTKPKPLPRDVPRVLRFLRQILLGRPHNSPLRFTGDISKRTQPQPNLPLGPSSKVNDNYYCDRDARGYVDYPIEVYGPEVEKQKLLSANDPWKRCEVPKQKGAISPGKVHNWDEIVD